MVQVKLPSKEDLQLTEVKPGLWSKGPNQSTRDCSVVVFKNQGPKGNIPGYFYSPTFGYVPFGTVDGTDADSRTAKSDAKVATCPHCGAKAASE